MAKAVVIGAGPAGLMAAEMLGVAGHDVLVADQMPSPARKFLMAGKSGLNITNAGDGFAAAFGDMPEALKSALDDFGAQDVTDWVEGLGQETFVGSTGRVFPKVMKASPLLRAWLTRLGDYGVELKTRWRWTGFGDGIVQFEAPDGRVEVTADIIVLAMGGASWKRLGSDGAWARAFAGDCAPFKPANMGFVVDWSDHMVPHFGKPVKGCGLIVDGQMTRGEFVVSERGIEGGGIYTVSRQMREGATLYLDLLPDQTLEEVRAKLAKRGKASLTNHLRKALKLDGVKIALLNEFGRPFPDDLAAVIKALPIKHSGPRPMDEAISVAGGLRFDALTGDLMLRNTPGVFAAGEMLDWEAPTGGYLLTACLATGRKAGHAAADYAARLKQGGV